MELTRLEEIRRDLKDHYQNPVSPSLLGDISYLLAEIDYLKARLAEAEKWMPPPYRGGK